MSKQKKKKLIRTIIICVLVVVVIGVAIWVIRNTGIGKSANVYSVSMVNYGQYYWDDTTLYGTVTDGKVQRVTKRDALVDEIKVKEGDSVNVGDVLMVYDISSYKIQIEQDEADIAVLKASINQAQVDIAKYQGLKPYEDAPEPETEVIDHGELIIKKKLVDTDLYENDMEFNCTASTKIKKSFLKALREYKYNVVLNIYDDDEVLYGHYYIDGENIPETVDTFVEVSDASGEAETETVTSETTKSKEVTYKKVTTDAISEDWQLENILEFDGAEATVDTTGEYKYYGTFVSCTPEQYERYEIIEIYPEDEDSDDYVYTREELASMIADLQKDISKYELELRQAEVIYAEDLLVGETGEVLSKIKGTVSAVNSSAAEGSEIIVIKGDSNYTIEVYVNELDLDKYNIGDEFTIYSYESGQTVTSKVESISVEPASSNYASGSANPNSSYYPLITVASDTDAAMSIGETCSATPVTSGEVSDTIYLPLMFVRSDSDGSYVMKSVDGKLKKQYVKTGKNLYGSAVEIKEGLTTDDYVAFPYDTGEKEGVSAVVSEELDFYY